MRRLLSVLVLSLAQPTDGLADGPRSWTPQQRVVQSPLSWTGFYVGLLGGMGWSDHRIRATTPSAAYPSGFRHTLVEPAGFVGGSHAGYNWQMGSTVLGLEAEMTGATLSGRSMSASPLQPGVTIMQEASLAGLAAMSGRLGSAVGDWLLYAKAGWAWGRFSAETITRNAAGASITQAFGDRYRDGWLIGGGVEYRFNPLMSLKAEYNFIDFGSARSSVNEFGAVTGGQKLFRSDEAQSHIVKVGISHSY